MQPQALASRPHLDPDRLVSPEHVADLEGHTRDADRHPPVLAQVDFETGEDAQDVGEGRRRGLEGVSEA